MATTLSAHMKNVIACVYHNHSFRVDEKGRKFYIVPTSIRRSGSMIVTEAQIKSAKKWLKVNKYPIGS